MEMDKKLKIITHCGQIPFEENFILSGLNLASTSFLTINEIQVSKNLIFWPDGIFVHRYLDGLKKIPGRNIIKYIKIPENIDTIHIIGNLSKLALSFLEIVFPGKKVRISKLPYDTVENIKNSLPQIYKNEICFITLPTPKQEQIADHYNKNEYFKIICIGGSIKIASGEEKVCPLILENMGLEFLWRLRTDTKRRLVRLLKSIAIYIKSEINGSFKKLKLTIIN